MARCSHNFKPCGPNQLMCSKCGLLKNTGTGRRNPLHIHAWHHDRKARAIVCKTCGAVK